MIFDLELVIKLPKELYTALLNGYEEPYSKMFSDVVKNGTPLPKGHGRLIDATKLAEEIYRAWTLWEKKGEDCYLFSDVFTPLLVSQSTVIDADKGEEDD